MDTFSIIRDLTFIGVSLYTAWWAYRSFAYKDQISELKTILELFVKIKHEAFFTLQLTPINKEKSSDITTLLSLVFDLNVKVGSALYINDSIKNSAAELCDFSNRLITEIIDDDQNAIHILRENYINQFSELKKLILEQIKHFR